MIWEKKYRTRSFFTQIMERDAALVGRSQRK